MVDFTIKLADEVIAVTALYDSTRQFCSDYLTDEVASWQVSVNEADIEAEQRKSDSQRQREGLPPMVYSPAYLETLALYRQVVDKLLARSIMLFHGSVIAVDGQAYLFTAPSGTGKSTHVRLWREKFANRAVMVNDDKPLIRLQDNQAIIYGTPWMGKHNLGNNVSYPLKAICYLQRGTQNYIESTSFSSLYPIVFQQTQRPQQPQALAQLLTCIDKLGQSVAFYTLYCTISPEAVDLAYHTMKGS